MGDEGEEVEAVGKGKHVGVFAEVVESVKPVVLVVKSSIGDGVATFNLGLTVSSSGNEWIDLSV